MSRPSKPIVGFIGVGIMGAPMASNLQKAGYRVVIHDQRRQAAVPHLNAGARWAPTPRILAEQCEVMFTCLPSLTAIESVVLGSEGLVQSIRKGHALFEMSTNSMQLLKRAHEAFAARGAYMLDAPVSGGGEGARLKKLATYIGGDKAVFQQYEPVLAAMCDQLQYIGPIGSGLVTKLVHNCASQCFQAVIAEAFAMGVKAGADPLALWEAVRKGAAGRRRSFDALAGQFLPGKFDEPQSALHTVEKDMKLATELGDAVGAPMKIASLVLADISEAMKRGWAERDGRSFMLLPQERAGVAIAVEPKAIEDVLRRDPPAPSDTQY